MLGAIRSAQQEGKNARAWSAQPAQPLAQSMQKTGREARAGVVGGVGGRQRLAGQDGQVWGCL